MSDESHETYEDIIDEIEARVSDDDRFPVVEDGMMKLLLKMILEFIKVIIDYLTHNINATQKEE